MLVLVHREGVRGIDGDSSIPGKAVLVHDRSKLSDLLRVVRGMNYLPAIDGGQATWVCEGAAPLAVVTQEYREAWLLPGADRRLEEVAGQLPHPHFLLRYLGHEIPEEAFRRYGGDPVRLPKEAWEPAVEISWSDALRRFLTPRRSF